MTIFTRPASTIYLLLGSLCLALTGCATSQGLRDATGNPQLVRLAPNAVQPAPTHPLSMTEVLTLARHGHPAEDIVARMRASATRFDMNDADRAALRRGGASPALIDALATAEAQAKQIDRLTAEADRAAEQAQRERARRQACCLARPAFDDWGYPFYPHVGFGYYRFGHRSGW